MSAHYTFLLTLPLRPEAASANQHALRHVLGDEPSPLRGLPAHPYFHVFDPRDRLHESYRHCQSGAMQSVFWMEFNDDGTPRQAGVNLCLPGKKLEAIAQDLFPLTAWLASLSSAEGPVGIVVAEDLPHSEPMVLYVRDKRLFVGTSTPNQARAIDDGSPYQSES
jgi:hypothetical protein